MKLVQVDPVRAQPAQGRLHGSDDVPTRPAGAVVGTVGAAHVHAELRRHHDVAASRSQRTAQKFLTQAGSLAVTIGRVEQGDPGIDTADCYGKTPGLSEELLGRALG